MCASRHSAISIDTYKVSFFHKKKKKEEEKGITEVCFFNVLTLS